MFDVGFSELLLLAIVALVVLGPEKLPHAARVAGAWVGRIRRTIGTMQAEIEREVASQEVRAQFEKQFRDLGGQDFVKGLQEERQALEGTLGEARQALQDSPAALAGVAPVLPAIIDPIVISAQPDAPADYSPEEPPPVLPAAATPPDEVALDGEQAYREWLASQRREHRIAPPTRDGEDPSA